MTVIIQVNLFTQDGGCEKVILISSLQQITVKITWNKYSIMTQASNSKDVLQILCTFL